MSPTTQSPGALRSVTRRFIQLAETLERVTWGVSIILFTLLVLLTVGTVFTRQVLNFVPVWSGEVQRYLGIWMTLLLAGPLVLSNNHLSVNIIYRYVSERTLYYIRLIQLLMIDFLGVIFVNWGIEYILDSGLASTSPSIEIQMLWIYLILPLSGGLIVIFATARIFKIRINGGVITDENTSSIGSADPGGGE